MIIVKLLQSSDGTSLLLNHILQNFCTDLAFSDSPVCCWITLYSSCSFSSCVDVLEAESIKQHAAWALKRVRDIFTNGPQAQKIKLSEANNVQVKIDKHFVLSLIQKLGHDDLVQPGKLFLMQFVRFWRFLHIYKNLLNGLLKIDVSADKDM